MSYWFLDIFASDFVVFFLLCNNVICVHSHWELVYLMEFDGSTSRFRKNALRPQSYSTLGPTQVLIAGIWVLQNCHSCKSEIMMWISLPAPKWTPERGRSVLVEFGQHKGLRVGKWGKRCSRMRGGQAADGTVGVWVGNRRWIQDQVVMLDPSPV